MVVTSCPKCRQVWQFNNVDSGRSAICPNCGQPFLVPANASPPRRKVSSVGVNDKSPAILAVVGLHIFFFVALWVLTGGGLGVVAFVVLVALEAVVWQGWRQPLVRSRGPHVVVTARQPPSPFAVSPQHRQDGRKFSDDPVELLRPSENSGSGQPIPSPVVEPATAPVLARRHARPNTTESSVRFFGPDSILELGRGMLLSPLTYAVAGTVRGECDASVIEHGLPVSRPGTVPTEDLPYWPSYRQASPEQRSYYLDWMLAGRRSADTPLGYVFIYFYGLERRILIERADHQPVIDEVRQLLPIYAHSRSFQSYGASFLWRAIYEAASLSQIPEQTISAATRSTLRWSEDTLALALATIYRTGKPLSPEMAMTIARSNPAAPSSVVVRRNAELFQQLFQAQYVARFKKGLELRAAKNDRKIDYRPASPSLLGLGDWSKFSTRIPNVTGLASQFGCLTEIWSAAIDELRDYDRAKRSANGKTLTAAMYEALPETLRTGDHPEFDAWLELWRRYESPDGPPLIPIAELAKLKDFAIAKSLTKKQSVAICTTADALGFGIEPDCRLTGKNYAWDSRVATFILDEPSSGMQSYSTAAMLLELGLEVARADGKIDEQEVRQIEQHLERRFELTVDQTKRLYCLRYLLQTSEPEDSPLLKKAVQALPADQRLAIGDFLVGIAASDHVISDGEVRALRRAYRLLSLDPAQLDRLLIKDPVAEQGTELHQFKLDWAAIAAKRLETDRVAAILSQAMSADDDEPELVVKKGCATIDPRPSDAACQHAAVLQPVPKQPDSAGRFDGLAAQYQGFLAVLLDRPLWSRADIESAARSQSLMLSGAIEAINEWSQDRFGDLLIEEGPEFEVHRSVIRQLTGEGRQ